MKSEPPFNPSDFTDAVAAGRHNILDYIYTHAPPTEGDLAKVMDTVGYMLQDISGWGDALKGYEVARDWVDALWVVYRAVLAGGSVNDADK